MNKYIQAKKATTNIATNEPQDIKERTNTSELSV